MRAEELLGNGSRLLLRASGTENKIRILAECPDEKRCLSAVEIIKNAISVFSK
jgi:phosphomannomutase